MGCMEQAPVRSGSGAVSGGGLGLCANTLTSDFIFCQEAGIPESWLVGCR